MRLHLLGKDGNVARVAVLVLVGALVATALADLVRGRELFASGVRLDPTGVRLRAAGLLLLALAIVPGVPDRPLGWVLARLAALVGFAVLLVLANRRRAGAA